MSNLGVSMKDASVDYTLAEKMRVGCLNGADSLGRDQDDSPMSISKEEAKLYSGLRLFSFRHVTLLLCIQLTPKRDNAPIALSFVRKRMALTLQVV